MPELVPYAKTLVAGVGLLMLLLLAGTVDREQERLVRAGSGFDPLRSTRAEFYAFFLFSLTGVMLTAGAEDLIWLFLALELTSLPTYVMVTISTAGKRSQEAGIKYFFLGALGSGVFLYGFTLLYGATGTTSLPGIHDWFVENGIGSIGLLGLIVSFLGLCFKIAAVPMHMYTPDVYEGSAAPVSAFLAFTPKAAGFLAIMLLAAVAGWNHPVGTGARTGLPEMFHLAIWVVAAMTMTVGNVLAILQNSIKRILAYSSIAHSGYMLVGIVAGPGRSFATDGLAAVLFYLFAYGVMNLGAFAVLGSVEHAEAGDADPGEIETVDDLKGLYQIHPVLAAVMALCTLSLLGLPPLLGFWGKLPLFGAGVRAGEIPLVILLGINSAISGVYYLRLAKAAVLDEPVAGSPQTRPSPFPARALAATLSAAGVLAFIVASNPIMRASQRAARLNRPAPAAMGSNADSEGAGLAERDDPRGP